MDKKQLDKVIKKIGGYKQEVIDLQTRLTAIPALSADNGGEGEKKKADYLKTYLKSLGLTDIKEYNAPDKTVPCGYRPNVVAVLKGKGKGPRLWIMAHTDVVPPGDLNAWTGDPWTVRVKGDKLIGRGVEDNQGGMVSGLLAVKAFLEAGITPNLPIGLVLVADEETGSKFGLEYLLNKNKGMFRKDDIIIVPDAGEPKGTMIEVAEKSIVWFRFETIGKQTHGSTPEKGRNAHKAASYLATRMDTLHGRYRKVDKVFEPPISTFEPTKREANVENVNTIPPKDVMYFDCRVLPHYKLSDIIKTVKGFVQETEKKFKVKIKVENPQMESAAPPTPVDAPVVKAISRAMKELRGRKTKPMGIGGGTVAKYFRDAGLPCAVWATMEETAHTPDEHTSISSIIEDAKVFAHIALQDV
jgi:succinyl-diaminopimelate desuccinylase